MFPRTYPDGCLVKWGHKWTDNFVYRIFFSEPPRFQLMCYNSNRWIDVEQGIYESYVARELHREQKEGDEAERLEALRQPIIIFTER